jgi:hypothetical protein
MRSNWNSDTEALDEEKSVNYFWWWLFACGCPISILGLFFIGIGTNNWIRAVCLFIASIIIAAAGGVMSTNLRQIHENHDDYDYVIVESIGVITYVFIQAIQLPFIFVVLTKHNKPVGLPTL